MCSLAVAIVVFVVYLSAVDKHTCFDAFVCFLFHFIQFVAGQSAQCHESRRNEFIRYILLSEFRHHVIATAYKIFTDNILLIRIDYMQLWLFDVRLAKETRHKWERKIKQKLPVLRMAATVEKEEEEKHRHSIWLKHSFSMKHLLRARSLSAISESILHQANVEYLLYAAFFKTKHTHTLCYRNSFAHQTVTIN